MNEREKLARDMIEAHPQSPLPWFSLGKALFDERRFAESAEAFEKCMALDASYAAALLALGDAREALGDDGAAKRAWESCAEAAMAQGHPTLAGEARERIEQLG